MLRIEITANIDDKKPIVDEAISKYGLKEKDIVLSIATKLGALLNGRGISIKYSRTNDTYLSLEERARLANY